MSCWGKSNPVVSPEFFKRRMEIVMKRVLLALCALFCSGTVASAGAVTLASPPILGSSSQNMADCFIYNFGSTPVTISGQIMDQNGNILSISGNNNTCTGGLAAGKTCSISNSTNVLPVDYTCKITVSGSSTTSVRAVLELRQRTGVLGTAGFSETVLQHQQLY